MTSIEKKYFELFISVFTNYNLIRTYFNIKEDLKSKFYLKFKSFKKEEVLEMGEGDGVPKVLYNYLRCYFMYGYDLDIALKYYFSLEDEVKEEIVRKLRRKNYFMESIKDTHIKVYQEFESREKELLQKLLINSSQ